MSPLILGPLLEVGKTIIDRFLPDPEAKRAAEAELLRMAMDGELKQTIAQLEINAKEAAHPSVWVSGWRPAVGWCCGLGFLWATIGHPLAAWAASAKGWPAPPAIDTDVLMYVLGGMLGLGGLRSLEKVKGAAK